MDEQQLTFILERLQRIVSKIDEIKDKLHG